MIVLIITGCTSANYKFRPNCRDIFSLPGERDIIRFMRNRHQMTLLWHTENCIDMGDMSWTLKIRVYLATSSRVYVLLHYLHCPQVWICLLYGTLHQTKYWSKNTIILLKSIYIL